MISLQLKAAGRPAGHPPPQSGIRVIIVCAMASPDRSSAPIVVLGAGLSGLIAARELSLAGHPVVVLDKGQTAGGRLATRHIGTATFDSGAQFFTVRGANFKALVEPLVAEGVVYEWCDGFDDPPDGYPRYAATGGMNSLAQNLAQGIDVRCGVEVSSLSLTDEGWRLSWSGATLDATAVIATPPVPQTMALLDRGSTALDTPRSALRDIAYTPTLAALVTLGGPSAIDSPGGQQLTGEAFTFVADNRIKAISEVTAVTLHSDHDIARDRWNDPDEAVLADLVGEGARWLGDSPVMGAQLKKWRYAGPVEVWPEACAVAIDGPHPLLVAGDAFDGPKVEGAFDSGLAAGRELLQRLGSA